MNGETNTDVIEEPFSKDPYLEGHLAFESFTSLAGRPSKLLVVDRTLQRREMKCGFLLAVSYMLSQRVRTWTSKPRVGILFPPGIGGYIANLAVLFSGKTPVNINFTLGPSSIKACIRNAEIDCILTASPVRAKLRDFPWPEEGVVDVVDALKELPKPKTLCLLAGIYLLPARFLAKLLKIPAVGGDAEAGLLFTSGSSGEPKGVVLSHRNILGNCAQIDETEIFQPGDKLLANLPIFHSFGFTVSLWYPILRGVGVVTVPSPLDFKKTAEVISEESASILVGTPTFYKPYLKRVEPTLLSSLKCVVAGAEKTPEGFAELWEETFGATYLEGYGLTETAPVVSVNTLKSVDCKSGIPGKRASSVGRLLPGQAARILNPDTMEDFPCEAVGLLLVKGPNIFSGYLNDSQRTEEVKKGEWFITGDLARFDSDGFLYIEGRLSRFSKIAGEMVPHGTIEACLMKAYQLLDAEQPLLAVAARPDSAKGEALVLISAMDIDMGDVRQKLIDAGLTNLWVPKILVRVAEIPTLATGKLNLKRIKELALESSSGA